MKKLFVLLFVVSLSGCLAAGKKYDYYTSVSIPVDASEPAALVLAVEDQRSYVLSGNKPPSFVGLQRDGFGVPFDVSTASGKRLTEMMSEAIERGLTYAGYTVVPVYGSKNTTDYIGAASENSASRIVVLKVVDWKSDVMMGITLTSDLQLDILDANGELLARSSSDYYGKIGQGSWATSDDNSRLLTAEFSQRVRDLFNDEKVRAALAEARAIAGQPTRPKTASTVGSSGGTVAINSAASAGGLSGTGTANTSSVYDVSGVYSYRITGSSNDFTRRYKEGQVSITQSGNEIKGTFNRDGKFTGTVSGDTVNIEWYTSYMGGEGEWTISDDRMGMEGTWRRTSSATGEWSLIRLEAAPIALVETAVSTAAQGGQGFEQEPETGLTGVYRFNESGTFKSKNTIRIVQDGNKISGSSNARNIEIEGTVNEEKIELVWYSTTNKGKARLTIDESGNLVGDYWGDSWGEGKWTLTRME